MDQREIDLWHMRRAVQLAAEGEGSVEPNPMVGCVIARGAEIIGEGFHRRFGAAHAEVEALRIAGDRARGATLYVTLEPCCHQGKTPPCARAIIAAGLRRVVVAQFDPFPKVQGRGVEWLRQAGIEVDVGLLEREARRLNAPYRKLIETGRPWVIAKWAMTLDGKLALPNGQSRWISGPGSREIVHALRGRVDAIVVGCRTAALDDPLLTARPPGPRVALRVVVDSLAGLDSQSQLVRTARETPVLAAVGTESPESEKRRLVEAGCEVFSCPGETHAERLDALLIELGRRRLTNVLVEGGGRLLGSLFDSGAVDEAHVFIAPKVFGAGTTIAGRGVEAVTDASAWEPPNVRQVGGDVYLQTRRIVR